MKRRELKKSINYLCGELMAECICIERFAPKGTDKEKVDAVMKNILHMQADLIERLSHVEPGSKKLFFKKLKEDTRTKTEEIVEQLKALL